MARPDPGHGLRHVEARASAVVLVCRKCSKKLDGGFGSEGDEALAKALRRSLGPKTKLRCAPVTIVEVGCLDLCPKNAVVVIRGDRPKDWVVVPRGMPVHELGAALGLGATVVKPEA